MKSAVAGCASSIIRCTASREAGAAIVPSTRIDVVEMPAGSNAFVSPTDANWPEGLTYCFRDPVAVSVTVRVYSTFDSAPKKTQYLPLTVRASSTLMTSSMLAEEKNQK